MAKTLNQSEQVVLLAILQKHRDAYGVSIREEIEKKTGKLMPLASIYLSLERLEDKGFIKPRQGAPTAERGGRAKTMYEITGKGQSALAASLNVLDSLRAGTNLAGALA